MSSEGDLLNMLRSLEARVSAIEQSLAGRPEEQPVQRVKKISAKEFLLTLQIPTETQKVLALAYFLERQEEIESFNVPDLEGAFRAAREKLPKNMNDAVNKNVARGFIMEAAAKKDSKKAWNLTATGERFVEEQMGRSH